MPDEQPAPPRVTIRVKRNGPYLIELEDVPHVRLVDDGGAALVPAPGRRVALCRCGGSSTKPFCDGTHRRNGFTDPRPEVAAPGREGGTPGEGP